MNKIFNNKYYKHINITFLLVLSLVYVIVTFTNALNQINIIYLALSISFSALLVISFILLNKSKEKALAVLKEICYFLAAIYEMILINIYTPNFKEYGLKLILQIGIAVCLFSLAIITIFLDHVEGVTIKRRLQLTYLIFFAICLLFFLMIICLTFVSLIKYGYSTDLFLLFVSYILFLDGLINYYLIFNY